MSSSTTLSGKENMSGPCKVCEKPGHGVHYGVWTCTACMKFFARFRFGGIEKFFCSMNSDCVLSNKQPRTICTYCRFQKCVEVGMAVNKSHRSSLDGQAQRAFTPNGFSPALPSPSMSSQSSESMGIDDNSQTEPFDPSELGEQQEIRNIVESYKQGCYFTSDKIDCFQLKGNFETLNTGWLETFYITTWRDYAKEYEADIRALVPFVNTLQDSFSPQDKAALLKRSAFQLYLLRRVRALNSFGLLLSDGRFFKRGDLLCLLGEELLTEMLQIVDRIVQLGCTDDDLAMFSTLVYYKPGNLEDLAHLNLQNPENLATAAQKFKKLFVRHALNRGVDQRGFQELIINFWPELERLNVMHQEKIQFLKRYRYAFPQDSLFVEVYDLEPETETVQYGSSLPSSSSQGNLLSTWRIHDKPT